MDTVTVRSGGNGTFRLHAPARCGKDLYAGKKTELVVMKDWWAIRATNKPAGLCKIAGLNIWENDGGAYN